MNRRAVVALLINGLCLGPALALEGQVVDPNGAPVAGALVAALLPADKVDKEQANFVETVTDAQGKFTLDTKGPSTLLLVSKEGFAAFREKSPSQDAPLAIALQPGLSLGGVVLSTKSGKPIVGATVLARSNAREFIDPKQPDRFAIRTKSLANGRYTLSQLSQDFYDLEATAPGFARATRRGVPVADGITTAAVNLTLSEGTSFAGDVRGSDGKPLQDANVRVVPRPRSLRGSLGGASSLYQSKTDAKGAFSIDNIPAVERYSLTVSHPDQTTLLLEDVKPTAAGRIAPLSLTMPAGAKLTATVKSPDGTPLSGKLTVVLTPKQPGRSALDRSQQPQTNELDVKDGALRLGKLPAGTYNAALTAEGYLPWTQADLRMQAGETVDLGEVALQAGELITGSVLDTQAQPVAGATVQLFLASRRYQPTATVTTDNDGRFRLAGASAESGARLTAFKTGAGSTSLAIDTLPTEAVTLTLQPFVTVRGRVLFGDPPKPLAVFNAQLILDKPDENSPLPPMLRGQNVRARAAVRDAGGQFSLQADLAGTYAVKIDADGFVAGLKEGLAIDAGATVDAGDITLSPGATLQVQVVEKGSGVAIAGASVGIQEPGLAGMMNSMDMSKQAADPITGTDGSAQLPSLPPGNHIVRVAHDSYAKTTATVTIEPNQRVASLRIEVPLGGALEGVVRNDKGVPVVGAMVMPQQGMMPDPAKSATTDEQGRYRIEHLPAGQYMVMVIPLDNLDESSPEAAQSSVMGRMKMQSIEVVDNKSVTLNFPASQVIAVSGVVRRGGKPVPATLMWVKSSAGSMASTNTDDTGAYKVEITSPGSYTVMVMPADDRRAEMGANASLSVEIPEGQSVFTKDLVLSEDKFTGTVRDGANGGALERAQLMALPIDDNGAYDDRRQGLMRQAVTDKDGRFSMESPTAGRWRITVSKPGFGNVVLPEINLKEGETPDEVDVALFPARERELRVVTASDEPISGAMAFGLTSFSGAELMTTSDKDGSLKLSSFADGTYDLIVVAAGYAPHLVKNFAVDEDAASATETVVLTNGETVTIKVVDESREPVKDATVSRLVASEIGDFGIAYGMIAMTTGGVQRTGSDGIVTLIPLEAGRYEVAVIAGNKRGSAKFEVKAGKRTEVSIAVK